MKYLVSYYLLRIEVRAIVRIASSKTCLLNGASLSRKTLTSALLGIGGALAIIGKSNLMPINIKFNIS